MLSLGDELTFDKTMSLLARTKSSDIDEDERTSLMEDTAKFIIANVQQNTTQILQGQIH